jgi:glycosyltransferase involved in cell wall biosynthesis
VIPALNAAATIEEQLDAVLAQRYDGAWDVIIADNGSTDRTAAIVRQRIVDDHRLTWVDASDQRGSAWARNVAARGAQGEVLAFCDADDIVGEGWLGEIVGAVVDDLTIAAGLLEDRSINSETVASWRPRRQATVPIAFQFMPFAPSGNMAITRAHFLRVGGFDSSFLKAHDVEFGWRAQLDGATVRFAPGAVVHYRYRTTLRGTWAQGVRSGRAAAQLFSVYSVNGMPRRSVADVSGDLWWLVSRLPFTFRRVRRGIWIRRFGELLGRATGAVQFRCWYL